LRSIPFSPCLLTLPSFPARRSSDLGEGYRTLFYVRTPHAALLRQSACSLYSERLYYGTFQGGARGGMLRPPFSGSGTFDRPDTRDRKSTRLNSSHVSISYAVFCLKK